MHTFCMLFFSILLAAFSFHNFIHPVQQLWHRIKVDSGIGLTMVNVLKSTLEWTYTVKNAVELFFAFHPDVEKIQYH